MWSYSESGHVQVTPVLLTTQSEFHGPLLPASGSSLFQNKPPGCDLPLPLLPIHRRAVPSPLCPDGDFIQDPPPASVQSLLLSLKTPMYPGSMLGARGPHVPDDSHILYTKCLSGPLGVSKCVFVRGCMCTSVSVPHTTQIGAGAGGSDTRQ